MIMEVEMKSERPIAWLERASPEEIGEALLSVGREKAARVVAYVLSRVGPELGSKIDRMVDEIERDPGRVFAKFAIGGLNRMFGD